MIALARKGLTASMSSPIGVSLCHGVRLLCEGYSHDRRSRRDETGIILLHPPQRKLHCCSQRRRAAGDKARDAAPPLHLLDDDIEERFVKGSGPGGQKINKVRNCVQLTHRPTGVSVSCQVSRELTANRHIARKRLTEKVEFHLRGEESKAGRRIAKIRDKKARAQRKSRKKHQGSRGLPTPVEAVAELDAVTDGKRNEAEEWEEAGEHDRGGEDFNVDRPANGPDHAARR